MSLLEYLSKTYQAEQAGKKPAQPVDPSRSLLAASYGPEIRLFNLHEETYSDLVLEPAPKPKPKKKKAAIGGIASPPVFDYDWSPSPIPIKISFDPSGRYLAVLYSGASFRIWDVTTCQLLNPLGPSPVSEPSRDFYFAPDGSHLILRGDLGLHLYSFPSLSYLRTVYLHELSEDLGALPTHLPLLMLDGAQALTQGHSGLHLVNLVAATTRQVLTAPFVSSQCRLLRTASGGVLYVDHVGIKRLDPEFNVLASREAMIGSPVANPAWDLFSYVNLDTSQLTVLDSQSFETEFSIPESSGFSGSGSAQKFSADGYHLLYYNEGTSEIHIRDIRDPTCKMIGILPLPLPLNCSFDIQPQLAFST